MLRTQHITTIGSVFQDIFFYTDQGVVIPNHSDMLCPDWVAFERAAKIEGHTFVTTYGGGAANTAVTFARLGLTPSLIGAVGGDAAAEHCLSNLRKEGVQYHKVQKYPHQQTGTAIILNIKDRQSDVKLVFRGASASLKLTPAVCAKIRTPWVYLTALGGQWNAGLDNLLHQVKNQKLKLAWNPGAQQIAKGVKGLSRFLRNTEVLLVNHDEALELAVRSKLVTGMTSARNLARLLQGHGPHLTVVTVGHRGAYLYDGKKMHFQPAKIGKTVNKTGAGDAFGSGLITGLIKYGSIERALKLAMYNSHAVVGAIGAQTGILHRGDLQRLHI